MNKKYEYMLHTWGGLYNNDSPTPKELRKYEGYTFFQDKCEMDIVIEKLKKYSDYGFMMDIKNVY